MLDRTNDLSSILFEQRVQDDDQQRLAQYDQNWRYYNGDHKRPLKVKQGQADDNVVMNLARIVVDKGASFLFGKPVDFELEEGTDTPPEQYIDDVWQRNRKMTLMNKMALSGGVCGHLFVKIVPDGISPRVPRLVVLDPAYVRVAYSDDDIADVFRYRIQFTAMGRDGRAVNRRQDIERDDGGRWGITNWIARGGGRWEPDGDEWKPAWRWPWPPIVDCQNLVNPHEFYGLSDLEDLSLQDGVNFTASNVLRVLRYHAHPKTWGKGIGKTDIEIGADDVLLLKNDKGELHNLEMQSDLGSSLEFLRELRNGFLASARVPRMDPAQVNVGALSGFALKVLYGDLLEKTGVKRCTYGDLLVELNRRLCELGGHGPERITALHWQDPLPEDEQAEMTRDKFELDYKLASQETVRARRGLDQQTEGERIQAEEAASGNIGALLLRQFETQRNA
jgi:hypothetical protein